MLELMILFTLALIWIIFAVIQDLKSREIADWLNYSLIIFALGFRFFYSFFNSEWNFFLFGVGGFIIFFGLANLFYYSRLFAGGDAKLFMALGAILPLDISIISNLKNFGFFIFLFLVVGALYGLIYSLVLGIKNFKKLKREFNNQFNKNKLLVYSLLILALIVMCLAFVEEMFFFLGILIFIFPYLFLYSKSVDEVCMIRNVPIYNITEGDWLYEDVKIGKTVIKANWDGLNKEDIILLMKKKKSVLIRYGIQYAPVFLISFILFVFGLLFNWFNFL